MSVHSKSAALPALALLGNALVWGLSWIGFKALHRHGLHPLWSTAVVFAGALLALLAWQPASLRGLARHPHLLALAAAAGVTNIGFNWAVTLGDVVRVMFLFYLSPVWSVLGGWLFLKERIPPTRWAAVVAAIVGLWLVLGGPGLGGGEVLAFTWVDALSLSAGFAFAANNVIARAAHSVPLRTKTFCVFIGCGLLSALASGLTGQTLPAISGWVVLALLAYGFGWMLLATVTWQYGVSHLESSRAGVILLAELVVSVGTALAFGGESLTPMGWAGGALIAVAALAEALASPAPDTPSVSVPVTGVRTP